MLIKVTALSKSTKISTVSFDKPTIIAINVLKITAATPIAEGKTEILMDSCIFIVKETPEEIVNMTNDL